MIVRNVLAALGFLGIAAAAVVGLNAYSGDFGDNSPPRLNVSFRGLDLTSRDGIDELDDRIDRAIGQVCGSADPRDLRALSHRSKCRDDAWAGVRPQIDRAVERVRWEHRTGYDGRGTVFDDIAQQSRDARKAIGESLGSAFASGINYNWYSWDGAKGFVYVQPAYVDRDETCRIVTVTRKRHGQQMVLAQGPVCRSPYGALESPPVA